MFLGIDTSIGTSVAVIDPDGVVRAERGSENPLGHAEVIGTLLQRALEDAAMAPAQGVTAPAPGVVTHVAAGMGPGPFTGLRIGIAAARAFALARGIPVVPVISHDAVALGILLRAQLADAEAGPFAVVTDARRREYAWTVYDGSDDDGLPVRVTEPALVARDEIDLRLDGIARVDATAVPASMLALVAARTLAAGRVAGPDQPLYLRAPDVTVGHAPKRVSA